MAAQPSLPNLKWIHWSHSGVAGSLRIKMPKSKYVYMNYADVDRFSNNSGIQHDDVRVIFNDKDPRLFFRWNEHTNKVADRINLFNRDIIQTYPMCSTRMDAKGLFHVVKIFGKLKSLGNKVLLIVVNSNARKQADNIKRYIDMAKTEGLLANGASDDEFLFTSTVSPDYLSGMPRDTVKDLMLISNLFIFPSTSEVCSNVLLEASMTKQLLVLNRDFAPILDFGDDGKTVLAYNFGSLIQSGYRYRADIKYLTLAKIINQQLKSSKSNLQFLKILNTCNIDWIYHNQWETLLYEKY
jgi:glycosyltransferase involved in cell wall biosynthesis